MQSLARSGAGDSGFGRGLRSLDPVMLLAAVLAHQGGWDEILLVLVPIVVVAWLLWLAKRRVSRAAATEAPASPPAGPDSTPRGDD